jgi:DNA polymerase III epsilon subunit-like protein
VSLPFVALALTTTGPDPRRDRVSSVSVVAVDANRDRTRFDAVVRPKDPSSDPQSSVMDGAEGRPFEAEWPEIAARLRVLLGSGQVVAHDADRSLAVLAAEGLRLEQAPLDTAELASILVPALAATDLDTLADALGVVPSDDASLRTGADVLTDIFEALLVRIAAYDDVTLERLATHVSEGGWHFAQLFEPRFAVRFRPRENPRHMPPEIAFLRERPREDALEPTGSLEPLDP